MRILFLHPNFPGQFVRPALLMAQLGHDVRFLCHTHYDRQLPGVTRIKLKGALGSEALEGRQLKGHAHSLALADQYRRGMEQLRASGWQADLVVSHSGWGCGLHSSLVWPEARRIAYVEWWFAAEAELYSFDPGNRWWPGPVDGLAMRDRNFCLALELSEADTLVAPTQWQRSQLPRPLRDRCLVVPDGVDCKRFKPDPSRRNPKPLLTYGTRGMEPMRGFPEFIQELPHLLQEHQELEVEIAGEDRICYGGQPPEEGSFGQWAAGLLAEWIEDGRVRFLGRLDPSDYEQWLQRSWIHVHLTRPFVASWSLLEAMASGCCLVASNTPPVSEFLDHSSGELVDHRQRGWLSEAFKALIGNQPARTEREDNARRQSLKWSEDRAFKAWGTLVRPTSTTSLGAQF